MAFIKIPEGKTEVQIGGSWVKIPAGAKEMEIPDHLLAQGANLASQPNIAAAPQQNATAVQNTQQNFQMPSEYANTTRINYTPEAAREMLANVKPAQPIMGKDQFYNPQQEEKQYDDAYRAIYAEAPNVRKQDDLKDKIALAQNTTIWQKLTGGKKEAEELQKDLDYIAKNAGYELGAVQTDDGKIYFGTTDAKGNPIAKELTPGILNDLAANKGEIIGGITATALAPFTGGGSFLPLLGASATGTALGSMSDLYRKGEATGREYDVGDYAARALQSAGADALGGVAINSAGKLVKAAAPAVKRAGEKVIEPVMEYGGKAIDLAKKASDWGLVGIAKESLKGLPMANAGGAKKAISAIVGDEADEILKNAEKLGGYKVDNNNFTDLQILNKPINFIKDHLANTAGKLKLDKASDFLNNAQGVNKVQREIVDFALGDNKATSNVINALQGDKTGQAARNLAALAQSDVNAVRQILPKTAKGEISRDVSNFYARVSDDFGKMEEGIAQSLGGKTTTLSSEAIQNAKEAMVKNLNAFELKTPEAKTLLGALENLKDKPMDFSQLRKIKKDFNEYAQRIFNKDGHYGQKVDTSAVGKIIDDAVDRLIEGTPNAKYLKSELAKYSDMSKIRENPFFEKIIDPNSSADDVLSAIFNADKAQGDILAKFSKQLSPAELEKFETDLLNELFNSQIAKRGTRNITEVLDGIGLRENLQKINLKSEVGKDLKDAMLQLANARGNLVDVFAAVDKKFIKPTMPRAGIAQTPEGLLKSILINRLKQSVFKYVGKVGNDAALDYHLREGLKALKVNEGLGSFMQAVKNSGASDEVAEGIAKAVIDQGREIAAKNAAKEAQDAVKAKFSPEELKKALIDPNLTTQEKVNLVGMAKKQIKEELDKKAAKVAKGELAKQGEGFMMKDSGVVKSDYNVKFELSPNVRDLAKLQTDEISADLEYLANKHPEMFSGRPANVFKLIREIKENPTHFYANNRLDYGLIVKRLDGNKIGKLAVEKQTGDVKHATKVKDKDLKRLEKISKEKSEDAGIIQTFTQPGSKLENQGLGYQTTSIIPQSSQKVKELPPADLRKAIINAKDDKERLAIIENQKAGIRQNIDTKAIIDASPQSGRNMALIGRENLNGDIVKYILESNKKAAVEKLNPQTAKDLGFKYPDDVRRTLRADDVRHILKDHGKDSAPVKAGTQKEVTLDDIARFSEYADEAQMRAISTDKSGERVLVSGKQINGYYVIVEQVRLKNNELGLKTMFFEKGSLKNYKGFASRTDKSALTHSGYEPEVKLDLGSAKPSASEAVKPIIPQNLKNASIDEWQSEISKAKDDWNGLKRLMDQIKQNETLGQNERAKLYVDISDRMKELRRAGE